MGMAASQGRFLQLTSRKNSIGLQLTRLSNQKVGLTREMQKVTKDYREALNTKTLKWSDNGGVSYVDLSYSNLMTPSSMNKMNPYVLTDSSDKVVIASNYEKYAKMISPDGKPGGDYESNRMKILSELIGVDESQFANYNTYQQNLDDAQINLEKLYKEKDKHDKEKPVETDTEKLLETAFKNNSCSGGTFDGASNWKDAYHNNKVIKFTDQSGLDSLATQLKTLAPYFSDIITEEKFGEAVKNVISGLKTDFGNIDKQEVADSNNVLVTGKKGEYKVNVQMLISNILGQFATEVKNKNGYTGAGSNPNAKNFEWCNPDEDDYTTWKVEDGEIAEKIKAGEEVRDAAKNALASVFDSEQEGKIAFYDAIFTAIAEKGWTQNDKVTDNDYLNAMLQNGAYSITTMEKSLYTDGQNKDGTAKFRYEYSTDIAENDTHVYKVNDTDVQNEALADYEYKKSIINTKETRIDTRMEDLKTEQSAIQQMLQGIEQVRNDNIERTFSIFG